MKTLYQNSLFKIDWNSSTSVKRIKGPYLTQIYKKKIFLILYLFVFMAIPVVIEFFLKTSYLTSLLIIFVFYPFCYALYRIDKRVMSCKYMP